MRLVQLIDSEQKRRVAVVNDDGTTLQLLNETERVYDLALLADHRQTSLQVVVEERLGDEMADYMQAIDENRLLVPLDHPDPAHCILSGTGLDHLGSAQARDSMHAKLNDERETLTDSMKMFKLGLEGGKPAPGKVGVAPEWFYKGDGRWLVAPGHPLTMPPFAEDGGEEPELVGLYVIGETGNVLRVGFALGNEFSDHVIEKQNYLYLAHSKLRASSFGPELLVGEPPAHIQGTVRILRNGAELWSAEFLTGEANMTHTLANLQHHHFKYDVFRTPGDVHCHYYGTSTLSFASGITTQSGDVFEISAPEFGQPLRNPLQSAENTEKLVEVKTL
ncbi:MAG: AraD1 family protein [Chloroflexota bacterium]